MNNTLVLLVGAAVIAIAGYLLDRRIGLDMFARAGAVMVVYGVTMVGRGLYKAERAISRHHSRLDRLEAGYLDAIAAGEKLQPDAFRKVAEHHAEFRTSRFDEVSGLLRGEIAIVCLGTLIWGFGDLAV
jgi:hypothetical protein